ncbi:MAG: hypothetical protein AB3N20_02710 [Rhizobiaceae bacterium]
MAKDQIRSSRDLRKRETEKKPVAVRKVFGKREKGVDGAAPWAKKPTT